MSVSVINLNWNELGVSKDSVRRLLKEPGVSEIIVVDNGSTDGSKEYFRAIAGTVLVPGKELKFKTGNQKLTFIDWPMNTGPSVARNMAISVAKGDSIFLIDGDILYVPGTIEEYAKILKKYPDAFCVGQNNLEILNKYGHNGTPDPIDADFRMGDDYEIDEWFPMAWTQYGLFRTDLLRKHPFIEEGAFGEAGYGYEDDWHWHEMNELGYVSLAVSKPIYYHEAHTGIKELVKAGLSLKLKERKKILEKKWGKNATWAESIAKSHDYINRTTRPKP